MMTIFTQSLYTQRVDIWHIFFLTSALKGTVPIVPLLRSTQKYECLYTYLSGFTLMTTRYICILAQEYIFLGGVFFFIVFFGNFFQLSCAHTVESFMLLLADARSAFWCREAGPCTVRARTWNASNPAKISIVFWVFQRVTWPGVE